MIWEPPGCSSNHLLISYTAPSMTIMVVSLDPERSIDRVPSSFFFWISSSLMYLRITRSWKDPSTLLQWSSNEASFSFCAASSSPGATSGSHENESFLQCNHRGNGVEVSVIVRCYGHGTQGSNKRACYFSKLYQLLTYTGAPGRGGLCRTCRHPHLH